MAYDLSNCNCKDLEHTLRLFLDCKFFLCYIYVSVYTISTDKVHCSVPQQY